MRYRFPPYFPQIGFLMVYYTECGILIHKNTTAGRDAEKVVFFKIQREEDGRWQPNI